MRCLSLAKQETKVFGCEPAQRLRIFTNRALKDQLLLLLRVSTARVYMELVAWPWTASNSVCLLALPIYHAMLAADVTKGVML